MKTLITIHDVMPETLDRVACWVERLHAAGHRRLTLLVVPGRAWGRLEVRQLQRWEQAGIVLAAHGWVHQAPGWGGWYHRLHGALLSRAVAEHLALQAQEIVELMRRAHGWFPRQGLRAPTTYVPPAWALGAVDRHHLATLPYRRVEVLRGVMETSAGRLRRLPLLGFEAEGGATAFALRAWNWGQWRWACGSGAPLRIAIHPNDEHLRLRRQLIAVIHQVPPSWRMDQMDQMLLDPGEERSSRTRARR
ncbi:MAG: DUF2334 domain-containing protein [Halorhodospira sp.]